MECKQCGGQMMPETVIELRRSFIGFREMRSAGAYCATCQIGIPVESDPPVRRQDYVRAPLARRVHDRLADLRGRCAISNPGLTVQRFDGTKWR